MNEKNDKKSVSNWNGLAPKLFMMLSLKTKAETLDSAPETVPSNHFAYNKTCFKDFFPLNTIFKTIRYEVKDILIVKKILVVWHSSYKKSFLHLWNPCPLTFALACILKKKLKS